MALPKVCGIETEYGIVVRGGDNNPVSASSTADQRVRRRDHTASAVGSAGTSRTNSPPTTPAASRWTSRSRPEVETTLVNAVLTNGARYYVDHAHPEISTPEVTTAREAVVWDRAAEEIVRASMEQRASLLARRCRDHRPQEQLRRQGQQLRLPRELPAGTRDSVRSAGQPDHAAFRHPADLLRCRQGRLRAAGPARRRHRLPDQPASRLLRRGDRPRDHAEAADRQHPRRAARRSRRSTGGCT